ncbi:MAG: aldo/keto reductase, partial [Lentisphaeria bacterium]|nr:aldo/keto reductase [Lentisphaeria bacterium]
QGVLSTKYLNGIPADSRAVRNHFLKTDSITPELRQKVAALNEIALARSQSLAQMALSWILSRKGVTSVLIGASKCEQIAECAQAPEKCTFTEDEYKQIDHIVLK